MSHTPLTYRIYIILIILVAGGLIVSLCTDNPVSINDLHKKSGVVASATCVKSRSVYGIKLQINYSGTLEKDYFSLPININCIEVASELKEGSILTISYFENAYFGISVGDKVIRNTEQAISDFNDKTGSIMFLSFIAFVSILALYWKGRHVTSKGSGRVNAPLL